VQQRLRKGSPFQMVPLILPELMEFFPPDSSIFDCRTGASFSSSSAE